MKFKCTCGETMRPSQVIELTESQGVYRPVKWKTFECPNCHSKRHFFKVTDGKDILEIGEPERLMGWINPQKEDIQYLYRPNCRCSLEKITKDLSRMLVSS
jgi:hypothetical protein